MKTECVAMGGRTPDIIPSRYSRTFSPMCLSDTYFRGVFLPHIVWFLVSAVLLLLCVSYAWSTVSTPDWLTAFCMCVCLLGLVELTMLIQKADSNEFRVKTWKVTVRPKVFPKNGIKFPLLMLRMTVIEPVYLKLQPEFWIWLIWKQIDIHF